MEDASIENSEFISALTLKSDEVPSDKINRLYEFYDSARYSDVLSALESDVTLTSKAPMQVLLGNCYKQLGNKDKAFQHWKKAIEISPLEHSAYTNIANYYYNQGDINQAISNWHIASTIMPENPTVNLNLAHAYDKKGSRIKSTKYFEKFLKYETNVTSNEYVTVKHSFANLTAKVDFYAKKIEEYKVQKDLKTIASLYLKMISTYANLPSIYSNIAEIFNFDKNYEKAFEFYQIVYLFFPYTTKILVEMGNLAYLLGHNSYSYVYYKRALDSIPEKSPYYSKIKSQMNVLSSVLNDPEVIDIHLQRAKEAEANNDYEIAIDEYENYLILSESESPDIQQLIDKYKIFLNPEPFVVSVLYSQINELMNRKKLHACVDVCDRIMKLGVEQSKEVVYAMKCKSECKRIIIAREQFGV